MSDSPAVYDALCDVHACPPWRALPHSSERALRPASGATAAHTMQTWADWWSLRTATHRLLVTPSSFGGSAALFSTATACALTDLEALERCCVAAGDAEGAGRTEL